MLLANNFGRVFEVEDLVQAEGLLKQGLMPATDEQAITYRERLREREIRSLISSGDLDGVFFSSVQNSGDGYGMSREFIKSELFRLNVHLYEEYKGQKVGLLYSYPYGIIRMQTDVQLIYTMFESDKIPDEWLDYLKLANEVLVPSRWCQEVFTRSGIATTVVPLGYNDRIFEYHDRPLPVEAEGVFTFIHYNSFNLRKGFQEVFQAFTEEFKTNEPVKLILKTTTFSPPIPIQETIYPNIEIVKGTVSEEGIRDLLYRSHCMVYPSRGEGFGITPLEAMATGLPAIIPNAHGLSEYFNSDYMLEVACPERCPALYNRFKGQDVGEMVVCDVEDLRKKMRYAYNHQAEMKKLGHRASEYVKAWTYKKSAAKLKEVIDKWQLAEVPSRPESKYLFVEKF